MKACIWCSKTEQETSFEKLAHTIPRSLGGTNICEQVCDKCNHYFGANRNSTPSVETILKGTFNIARARFLRTENEIGKNKVMSKFSSEYFKIDFKSSKLSLKYKYRLNKSFQSKIGHQMKRGLYKIFLEENERQLRNSHNSRFDFIREFARYDIGDYPVIYFERSNGVIAMVKDWYMNPELILDSDKKMKYLIDHDSFVEFEFLGHVLGLATSRNWHLVWNNYIKKTMKSKERFFKKVKLVDNFNDIDLALSILD
ncbi:MAG: HNH endonuclease [Bacteroidota bacterium]